MEEDGETELHLAVLNEDYKTLDALKDDRLLKYAKDGLGFTAVELAKLLEKRDASKY